MAKQRIIPSAPGTVYPIGGDNGALGYTFGEGDDLYLVWDYESQSVAEFPLTEEGWLEACTLYGNLDPSAFDEVLVDIGETVLLGGFGYPLVAEGLYELSFFESGVHIKDGTTLVVSIPYEEVQVVELGGRGAITSGGGFIGGGFGLEGAAKGMLMAGVLNGLTRRTEVESIIRIETGSGELFLYSNVETPERLRHILSPVFGRIRNVKQGSPTGTSPISSRDPLERLVQLADLLERDLLTRDEYDIAKKRLLSEM